MVQHAAVWESAEGCSVCSSPTPARPQMTERWLSVFDIWRFEERQNSPVGGNAVLQSAARAPICSNAVCGPGCRIMLA
jgi:hypothetical protein